MQQMQENQQLSTLQGQVQVWQAMLAFYDTMVLRCALELGVADVIDAQGKPLSLTAIANLLSPPPSDLDRLRRVMRFLVRKGFFSKTTTYHPPIGGETLYGLTPSSKWLIKGAQLSLAPMVHAQTMQHQHCTGFYLCESIRRGITPHELAHGMDLWTKFSKDMTFNRLFNAGMACTSEIAMEEVMTAYGERFAELGSLVDVGGGTGAVLAEIVRRFPNIQGINFDQPHVVAGAKENLGVTHVGGNLFSDTFPTADAVFMKSILHCFDDEKCVKILRNCRKALAEKKGKLIIMEAVLSDEEDALGDLKVSLDIMMLIETGGKERTEEEWKKLLELGGFPRCNIIQIPSIISIIEAYVE